MGASVSVKLESQSFLNLVDENFVKDPTMVTKIVKECNKKVNSLNKKRKKLLDIPSSDDITKSFEAMDYNNNNMISLAEIDKYIVEGYPNYDNKPALMRAYKAADLNGNGFLNKKEFQNLWKYIEYFNNLWHAFDEVDKDNSRRISLSEFKTFSKSLFDSDLSDKEAEYLFDLIDKNNGGKILFIEFCGFMAKRKFALE